MGEFWGLIHIQEWLTALAMEYGYAGYNYVNHSPSWDSISNVQNRLGEVLPV